MGIGNLFGGFFTDGALPARLPKPTQSLSEKAAGATDVEFIEYRKPDPNKDIGAQLQDLTDTIMRDLVAKGVPDEPLTRQIIHYSVSVGASYGYESCADVYTKGT